MPPFSDVLGFMGNHSQTGPCYAEAWISLSSWYRYACWALDYNLALLWWSSSSIMLHLQGYSFVQLRDIPLCNSRSCSCFLSVVLLWVLIDCDLPSVSEVWSQVLLSILSYCWWTHFWPASRLPIFGYSCALSCLPSATSSTLQYCITRAKRAFWLFQMSLRSALAFWHECHSQDCTGVAWSLLTQLLSQRGAKFRSVHAFFPARNRPNVPAFETYS